MKGFSLEVRVSLLLLVAAVIMGGFLIIVGGINFKGGYQVNVDFDDPGSLKPGAAVRIAGVDAGTVQALHYLGGKFEPKTGKHPLVRAQVRINDDVQQSIHQDARFYVTSSGILGESFLAIDPGSDDKPVLAPDSLVVGIDPPRLDQALAMGYELLDTMVSGVRENKDEISDLFHSAGDMIKGANTAIGDEGGKLDAFVGKMEDMSGNAVTFVRDVREDYVEGPKVRNLVNRVDKTMQEATPLVKEVRASVNDMFGEAERVKIKSTIDTVASVADRSKVAINDANKALGEMKRGEGTVGQLLMNGEMYDDFSEFLKDLKNKPWKLFWRE
ncbi:MAG: MlaD family protein [Myxococcales bacterium]